MQQVTSLKSAAPSLPTPGRATRRLLLAGVAGAALLGGLMAVMSYAEGVDAGLGIGFHLAIAPLMILLLWRYPMAYLAAAIFITGMNSFGFLYVNGVFIRLMSLLYMTLAVVRLSRFNPAGRTYLVVMSLAVGASLLNILLHPSAITVAYASAWILPFFAFWVGIGQERENPESLQNAIYWGVALASIGIALTFLVEWIAGGMQLERWSLQGPFLNANGTTSVLMAFEPLVLAVALTSRGVKRLVAWGLFWVILWALLIAVSRTALLIGLLTPLAMGLRRIRWALPALLGVVLFAGLYYFGFLGAQQAVAISNEDLMATADLYSLDETQTTGSDRPFLWGLALIFGFQPHMLEGIGLGSSPEFYAALGRPVIGAHNFIVQTALEGGLILLLPMILVWFYQWGVIYRVLFTRDYWRDPYTYALALGMMNYFLYDLQGNAQMNIHLRALTFIYTGILVWRLAPKAEPRDVVAST